MVARAAQRGLTLGVRRVFMTVGRVNSVAHNFGHHFLWFRKGFVYAHIARRAAEVKIGSVTIDILREGIMP